MSGQVGTGTFDVHDLIVKEPAGADAPSEIVPVGGSFDLEVTFDGTGTIWKNLTNNSTGYEVSYFAEGIGSAPTEVDFGTKPGNLVPGTLAYSGIDTRRTVNPAVGQLPVGVYRLAALVTFPTFPGTTGFVEGLVIQVFTP